jgi:chorismate mutase-like protein
MEKSERNEGITDISVLREQIDSLDTELIKDLAQRMSLIPKVAEYKKANNLPRYQPKREAEVIESRRALAKEHGLNPDLVEKIMKLIIADAHRIEEEIIGQ